MIYSCSADRCAGIICFDVMIAGCSLTSLRFYLAVLLHSMFVFPAYLFPPHLSFFLSLSICLFVCLFFPPSFSFLVLLFFLASSLVCWLAYVPPLVFIAFGFAWSIALLHVRISVVYLAVCAQSPSLYRREASARTLIVLDRWVETSV